MKTSINGFFEGRIDKNNAKPTGVQAEDICKAQLGENADLKTLIIDAEKPYYIYSSGLRTVLKLGRQYPTDEIINKECIL